MRADIHDGQESQSLHARAGYRSARPPSICSNPACNARPVEVRRSPTRSKAPTKPKRAPADVDLKRENARLRLELTEALERQTATSEVLQVISSSPGELEPVFQKMLENATRVCGAKVGTMNLVEGDVVRRVASYNVPFAYADAPETQTYRPHPKSSLGQVISTRQAVHVPDLRTN